MAQKQSKLQTLGKLLVVCSTVLVGGTMGAYFYTKGAKGISAANVRNAGIDIDKENDNYVFIKKELLNKYGVELDYEHLTSLGKNNIGKKYQSSTEDLMFKLPAGEAFTFKDLIGVGTGSKNYGLRLKTSNQQLLEALGNKDIKFYVKPAGSKPVILDKDSDYTFGPHGTELVPVFEHEVILNIKTSTNEDFDLSLMDETELKETLVKANEEVANLNVYAAGYPNFRLEEDSVEPAPDDTEAVTTLSATPKTKIIANVLEGWDLYLPKFSFAGKLDMNANNNDGIIKAGFYYGDNNTALENDPSNNIASLFKTKFVIPQGRGFQTKITDYTAKYHLVRSYKYQASADNTAYNDAINAIPGYKVYGRKPDSAAANGVLIGGSVDSNGIYQYETYDSKIITSWNIAPKDSTNPDEIYSAGCPGQNVGDVLQEYNGGSIVSFDYDIVPVFGDPATSAAKKIKFEYGTFEELGNVYAKLGKDQTALKEFDIYENGKINVSSDFFAIRSQEGFEFDGWYWDSSLTEPANNITYSSDRLVEQGAEGNYTTLYAKWNYKINLVTDKDSSIDVSNSPFVDQSSQYANINGNVFTATGTLSYTASENKDLQVGGGFTTTTNLVTPNTPSNDNGKYEFVGWSFASMSQVEESVRYAFTKDAFASIYTINDANNEFDGKNLPTGYQKYNKVVNSGKGNVFAFAVYMYSHYYDCDDSDVSFETVLHTTTPTPAETKYASDNIGTIQSVTEGNKSLRKIEYIKHSSYMEDSITGITDRTYLKAVSPDYYLNHYVDGIKAGDPVNQENETHEAKWSYELRYELDTNGRLPEIDSNGEILPTSQYKVAWRQNGSDITPSGFKYLIEDNKLYLVKEFNKGQAIKILRDGVIEFSNTTPNGTIYEYASSSVDGTKTTLDWTMPDGTIATNDTFANPREVSYDTNGIVVFNISFFEGFTVDFMGSDYTYKGQNASDVRKDYPNGYTIDFSYEHFKYIVKEDGHQRTIQSIVITDLHDNTTKVITADSTYEESLYTIKGPISVMVTYTDIEYSFDIKVLDDEINKDTTDFAPWTGYESKKTLYLDRNDPTIDLPQLVDPKEYIEVKRILVNGVEITVAPGSEYTWTAEINTIVYEVDYKPQSVYFDSGSSKYKNTIDFNVDPVSKEPLAMEDRKVVTLKDGTQSKDYVIVGDKSTFTGTRTWTLGTNATFPAVKMNAENYVLPGREKFSFTDPGLYLAFFEVVMTDGVNADEPLYFEPGATISKITKPKLTIRPILAEREIKIQYKAAVKGAPVGGDQTYDLSQISIRDQDDTTGDVDPSCYLAIDDYNQKVGVTRFYSQFDFLKVTDVYDKNMRFVVENFSIDEYRQTSGDSSSVYYFNPGMSLPTFGFKDNDTYLSKGYNEAVASETKVLTVYVNVKYAEFRISHKLDYHTDPATYGTYNGFSTTDIRVSNYLEEYIDFGYLNDSYTQSPYTASTLEFKLRTGGGTTSDLTIKDPSIFTTETRDKYLFSARLTDLFDDTTMNQLYAQRLSDLKDNATKSTVIDMYATPITRSVINIDFDSNYLMSQFNVDSSSDYIFDGDHIYTNDSYLTGLGKYKIPSITAKDSNATAVFYLDDSTEYLTLDELNALEIDTSVETHTIRVSLIANTGYSLIAIKDKTGKVTSVNVVDSDNGSLSLEHLLGNSAYEVHEFSNVANDPSVSLKTLSETTADTYQIVNYDQSSKVKNLRTAADQNLVFIEASDTTDVVSTYHFINNYELENVFNVANMVDNGIYTESDGVFLTPGDYYYGKAIRNIVGSKTLNANGVTKQGKKHNNLLKDYSTLEETVFVTAWKGTDKETKAVLPTFTEGFSIQGNKFTRDHFYLGNCDINAKVDVSSLERVAKNTADKYTIAAGSKVKTLLEGIETLTLQAFRDVAVKKDLQISEADYNNAEIQIDTNKINVNFNWSVSGKNVTANNLLSIPTLNIFSAANNDKFDLSGLVVDTTSVAVISRVTTAEYKDESYVYPNSSTWIYDDTKVIGDNPTNTNIKWEEFDMDEDFYFGIKLLKTSLDI